jgi:hypothetical protein
MASQEEAMSLLLIIRPLFVSFLLVVAVFGESHLGF